MGSVYQYEFVSVDKDAQKIRQEALYEREKYPEDVDEPGMEIHAAPATRRHILDFLGAIENGGRPVADVEQGHISSASCIMANMSMELGRPLVYDPVKRKVVKDKEATKMLARPYRGEWEHPDPDKV